MEASADDKADEVSPDLSKKDSLLERLNKRNKERQNYNEAKHQSKDTKEDEGVDFFSLTFAERIRELKDKIDSINGAQEEAVANPFELAKEFADITVKIQELQQYLTTSTMFLTDFKIKACQNTLNEISNKCEETRDKLMPKKKFGFKTKKAPQDTDTSPSATSVADKADGPEKPKKQKREMDWTLSHLSKQRILLKKEQVNQKDITITDLTNCLVEIQGHPGSVQISDSKSCIFLFGPISRSLFVENCKEILIAAACQQLRLHSSRECTLFLHVTCRAIIEDCKQVKASHYRYDYATIDEDFVQSGLNRKTNNYKDIADFDWLSTDTPSPNWRLMAEGEALGYENLQNVCDKFFQDS